MTLMVNRYIHSVISNSLATISVLTEKRARPGESMEPELTAISSKIDQAQPVYFFAEFARNFGYPSPWQNPEATTDDGFLAREGIMVGFVDSVYSFKRSDASMRSSIWL